MIPSSGFPLSVLQQERFRFLATGAAVSLQTSASIDGAVTEPEVRSTIAKALSASEIYRHRLIPMPGIEFPLQGADADSESSDLIRIQISAVPTNRWRVQLSLSPILADATTLLLLLSDIKNALNGRFAARSGVIPFVQFSGWHRKLLNEAPEEEIGFWRNYPHMQERDFQIAFQKRKPEAGAFRSDGLHRALPVETSEQLGRVADDCAAAREDVLLSVWLAVLWSHSGRDRLTIGRVIRGRIYEELSHTAGPIDPTLPLFVQMQAGATFEELVRSVLQATEEIQCHQEYFRWDLLTLPDSADEYRFPFVFQAVALESNDERDAVQLYVDDLQAIVQPFRLQLTCIEREEGNAIRLDYDPLSFSPAAVNIMADQFVQLLGICLAQPRAAIGKLIHAVAAPPELTQWRVGDRISYPPLSITAIIDDAAKRHSDDMALVCGQTQWTYRELRLRSDAMASLLRSRHGVAAGDVVAFQCDRSPELVAGILAILKAGAAFVPIDPSYPPFRVQTILADSEARLFLKDDDILRLAAESVGMPQELAVPHSPKATAYIVYTSGSTGRPKGCEISMGSLVNYICWANFYYFGTRPHGSFPLYTSLSFDLTVTSLFSSLTRGKQLHIYPGSMGIDEVLADCLDSNGGVDSIKITPAHAVLLKELKLTAPRLITVIVGGEKLEWRHVQQLKALGSQVEIYNEYGPTEATVGCIVQRVELDDDRILIGRPIANTTAYIADAELRPLPPGMQGEIVIGGTGLAEGYFGDPALTSEKFMVSAAFDGERVYSTGDLGRWMEDGRLEYLGRFDDQVKIRGHRIELEEIKARLMQLHDVDQAVLTLHSPPEGEAEIVCYVRTHSGSLNAAELIGGLKTHLPEYMVPAAFIRVDSIPLTANGKVDVRALPSPDTAARAADSYVSPRNALEDRLASTWKSVLGIERIGIHDNFFELGGQSLKAAQVLARIHQQIEVQLHLRDLFNCPTIAALAETIKTRRRSEFRPIRALQRQQDYALSNAQRRLWVLHQMEPESIAYNMPGAFRIDGDIDPAVFHASYEAVVQRHEILRTRFVFKNGEPRQEILDELPFEIPFIDISTADDADTEVQRWYDRIASVEFRLDQPPLFRAELLRISDGRWVLLFNIHHIVNDGWSESVLMRECLQAYQALQNGEQPQFSPLPIQYKDYAAWQVSELQQESTGGHRDYWLQRFAGTVPPPAQLPVDFSRPAALSFRGASSRFSIDTDLAAAFRRLTRRADAGLFEGLLAVTRVLLYRYSHGPYTVIGTSVAGRNHIDLEDQVGFYVNTLPLKTAIETGDSFLALLEREKQTVREALDNSVYPFDVLVEELNLPHDTSRAPLFDVRVVMGQGVREFTAAGVSVQRMNVKSGIAKFDLVFNFAEAESGLEVEIDYSTDLFLQGTIERIFGHFEQLMKGVVAEPAKAVEHLRLLPVAEARLIQGFASGDHVPPPDETLASWFEKTAAAYPNRPAVITETGSCTYLELNALADRVAATIEQVGIRAQERVAVIGDRTTFWLAAMIGVMKSRATHVPLDLYQPKERLHYVLENSGCRVVIGSAPLQVLPEFAGVVIHPGNTAESPAREKRAPLSSDAAYIVYTSGSTGVPKGVVIEHGGFVNMIAAQIRGFGVVPDDRVLQFSSAAFDASLSEIFMTILTGAALVVPDMATLQSTEQFLRCLSNYKITIATLPPVYISALSRRLTGLKVLISAGEAANTDELRLYAERMTVFNAYGPTEASVCATFHRLSAGDSGEVAIGKPLPNTSVLILSPALEEMPIGVAGEIFLAGAGLARGYVDLPEATAQAFITHNGRRLYRTGDWGKWLANGNIVFLGRRDDQVKIRGNRVELEEVRQSILRHSQVSEATVLVDSSSGPPLLAAFYTSKSGLEPGALRQFLVDQVPGFLVPDVLAPILELPLTTNGKIDRAALRERLKTDAGTMKAGQAPSNSLESSLLSIWQRALGLESFGVNESFFDLGGNSLKAIHLVAGVQREFGVDLSLRTIFTAPTVRAMADRIQESLRTVAPIPAAPGQGDYPLTPTQRAIWASLQIEGNSPKFNMPAVAVFAGTLRAEALEQAVSDLALRFEALRAVVCMTNGEPRQRFLDNVRGFRFQGPAGNLDEFISRESTMLFDIENGPLFRVVLARDGASRWVLVTVLHHLIGDAWTMNLMQRELLRGYALRARGLSPEPARSGFRYRDYTCWFESLPGAKEMSDAREYWTTQLRDWPVCRLPADGLLEPNDTGGVIHMEFAPVLVESFEAVARQQAMTVFTFLSGCAAIWLSRQTGNNEVAMGAPFSGRVHAGFEEELGLFMNVVPLRLQVHAEMSGADFWRQVKTLALSASQHQSFPVETLASGVHTLRERGSSPLFYVELHLDQFDYTYPDELDSLPEPIAIGAFEAGMQFRTRKYEVELHFQWLAGRAALELVYDSTRFRAATAERWASELKIIMEAVTQHWSVWLQAPMKSILLEVDGRFKKVDREQRDQFSRRHRPSFQQLHRPAKSGGI